jgi:hypothetical protein
VSVPPEALLADYPEPLIEIAEELRAIVRNAIPEAIEAVRPGWRLIGYDLPLGRRSTFFAWIWPEPGHVHLGFPQGILMADPTRRLSGAGITKRARWLTFAAGDLIAADVCAEFTHEAARIAGLSRSERAAIGADLEARRGPG